MARVQMYSMEWCPYCAKAKALLGAKGIEYDEVDVTDDEAAALRDGRAHRPARRAAVLHRRPVGRRLRQPRVPERDREPRPDVRHRVDGGPHEGVGRGGGGRRTGRPLGRHVRRPQEPLDDPHRHGPRRAGRHHASGDQLPRHAGGGGPRARAADVRAGLHVRTGADARRARRRHPCRRSRQGARARLGQGGEGALRDPRQRGGEAPAGDPRRGRVRRSRRGVLLHLRRPVLSRARPSPSSAAAARRSRPPSR